jgi:hypothetical protein
MDPLIIPIVALLIPMIIVPTAMGIKHARYLREVEHKERMRAMELGRTLAEDESWSPMTVALIIGAGVPIVALGIAFNVSQRSGPSDVLWMAAGMIGVAGVICGSILAGMQFSKRDQPSAASVEKPAYDPDQFDVVGSRG